MITNSQMKKIISYSKKMHSKNDPGHRYLHVLRNLKLTRKFARKYKANTKIAELACYLHDIARNKKGDHGDIGAKMAKKFLKKIKVDDDIAKKVCYVIKMHNKLTVKAKNKELRALQDADRIDAIGYLGFIRCIIHLLGTEKRSLDESLKISKRFQYAYCKQQTSPLARKLAKKKLKESEKIIKALGI